MCGSQDVTVVTSQAWAKDTPGLGPDEDTALGNEQFLQAHFTVLGSQFQDSCKN